MEQLIDIGALFYEASLARCTESTSDTSLRNCLTRGRRLARVYIEINEATVYSKEGLERTAVHLRNLHESGAMRLTGFNALRKIIIDAGDIAEYGRVSEFNATPWGKSMNPLTRPVRECEREDMTNVVGLSFLVLSAMEREGYSKETLKHYRYTYLPAVIKCFDDFGTREYSGDLIERLIEHPEEFLHDYGHLTAGRAVAAAKHIKSMHDDGELYGPARAVNRLDRFEEGPFGELVHEYSQWRRQNGVKDSTIVQDLIYISSFLRELCPNGPEDMETITRERVRDARAELSKGRTPEYVTRLLSPVRVFARFCEERHPEYPVFRGWVGKCPRLVKHQPIEGYSLAQTDSITSFINTEKAVGKRDLAMVLLMKNTGLRACDVASLRILDIDWERNEISVVQEKTGVPLSLPLDVETGEALADYILNARRKTDSEFVFLTSFGLAAPLTASAVSSAVRRLGVRACGPTFKGKHGSHALRRGLGARMTDAGVSLSDVADVLGHASPESALPYTAVSTSRLRACCATLDNCPLPEKGGHDESR